MRWYGAALLCAVLTVLSGPISSQQLSNDRVISGQEELRAAAVLVLDNLTFENDSSIRANGFSLNIIITNNLIVRGEASI